MKKPRQKHRQKLREEFVARGETFADWAKRRGYKPRTVAAVIDGELKGTRGVSHKIAVELGIKADPNKLKKAA